MEAATILDLKIHKTSPSELIEYIAEKIKDHQKLRVFHLNVHAFNVAFKDKAFADVINDADLVFCDGFGVKLGARILGKTIGERMTPPDWIDDLCQALAKNGQTIYLLGDEDGIAGRCAERLKEKAKELKVVGAHHGFFNKEGVENDEMIRQINKAKPDVLLVGFGMPLQEKWVAANFEKLDVKIFITVGAMFRWLIKEEKRAPQFLSSNGFEGVWRLFTQPRKVWKRYILEVPYFFFKVIKERMRKRTGAPGNTPQ